LARFCNGNRRTPTPVIPEASARGLQSGRPSVATVPARAWIR
jgi:hypothetical protein